MIAVAIIEVKNVLKIDLKQSLHGSIMKIFIIIGKTFEMKNMTEFLEIRPIFLNLVKSERLLTRKKVTEFLIFFEKLPLYPRSN